MRPPRGLFAYPDIICLSRLRLRMRIKLECRLEFETRLGARAGLRCLKRLRIRSLFGVRAVQTELFGTTTGFVLGPVGYGAFEGSEPRSSAGDAGRRLSSGQAERPSFPAGYVPQSLSSVRCPWGGLRWADEACGSGRLRRQRSRSRGGSILDEKDPQLCDRLPRPASRDPANARIRFKAGGRQREGGCVLFLLTSRPRPPSCCRASLLRRPPPVNPRRPETDWKCSGSFTL